ncbi:hypothetical protein J6590_100462 [Homalodisca vitripennis]|nr:hypothetical protein J6590_100462 [Homalodisca vitripennis]
MGCIRVRVILYETDTQCMTMEEHAVFFSALVSDGTRSPDLSTIAVGPVEFTSFLEERRNGVHLITKPQETEGFVSQIHPLCADVPELSVGRPIYFK